MKTLLRSFFFFIFICFANYLSGHSIMEDKIFVEIVSLNIATKFMLISNPTTGNSLDYNLVHSEKISGDDYKILLDINWYGKYSWRGDEKLHKVKVLVETKENGNSFEVIRYVSSNWAFKRSMATTILTGAVVEAAIVLTEK